MYLGQCNYKLSCLSKQVHNTVRVGVERTRCIRVSRSAPTAVHSESVRPGTPALLTHCTGFYFACLVYGGIQSIEESRCCQHAISHLYNNKRERVDDVRTN